MTWTPRKVAERMAEIHGKEIPWEVRPLLVALPGRVSPEWLRELAETFRQVADEIEAENVEGKGREKRQGW